MAKVICDICKNPAGFMKCKYPDGVTCAKCFGEANAKVTRMYKSVAEVRKVLEQDFSKMTSEEKAAFKQKFDDERKETRMAEIQAKIKEINKPVNIVDNTPRCPKCGSTSISADKKGYGIGKGVVGAAVAGPLGLVLGNAGAKKVRITCLACGYQWMAGKK